MCEQTSDIFDEMLAEGERNFNATAIATKDNNAKDSGYLKQLDSSIKVACQRARDIAKGLKELRDEELTVFERHELSTKLAVESEFLTKRMREIVIGAPLKDNSRKRYMLDHAAEALGITVGMDDVGVVRITLPALLPGRSSARTGFVSDPLYEVVEQFIADYPNFKRFDKCTIWVTHVYDWDLPTEGRIRDFDNLELKEIIDIINPFLLKDDSPKWCSIYQDMEKGDTDATHILIMKDHQFARYFARQFA